MSRGLDCSFVPTASAAFILLLATASTASGQDARLLPRPMIGAPCAGFFPGCPQGPERVQERLRVEQNARRDMSPFDRPAAFAPLPQGNGPLPAHLRLNGGFGGPSGPRGR